jgi:hypothetical protein
MAALPYGKIETARTPFEAYYNGKPDVSNLRTVGCAAYPLNSIERLPRKYAPRIRGELVFVGMKGSKIWRLLNKETLEEEVSGNTSFNEYLFPQITGLTDGSEPRKAQAEQQPAHDMQATLRTANLLEAVGNRTNKTSPSLPTVRGPILAKELGDQTAVDQLGGTSLALRKVSYHHRVI